MRRFFFDRSGGATSEPAGMRRGRSVHVASHPALRTDWRSRPLLLIVFCGLAMLGMIVAGAGLLLLQFREHTLVDREHEIQKLALTLAEQADRSFQAMEVVQKSVINRMQTLGIATSGQFEQRMSTYNTHLMLKDIISGLPHVGAVMMISAQGKLINSSKGWPAPNLDVTDQDYFKTLKSIGEMVFFF